TGVPSCHDSRISAQSLLPDTGSSPTPMDPRRCNRWEGQVAGNRPYGGHARPGLPRRSDGPTGKSFQLRTLPGFGFRTTPDRLTSGADIILTWQASFLM